jgi:hypothetical protein
MSGDLIGWIVGIIAALLGVGGLYVKGRSVGKQKEKAKQDEINRQVRKKHDDLVNKAKSIQDVVDGLSDSDAEQRLRDRYTRD